MTGQAELPDWPPLPEEGEHVDYIKWYDDARRAGMKPEYDAFPLYRKIMPTIDDLFEIYNYIRGQVTGDGVIVNESSMASTSTVTGWVDGCADSLLFTVAWHDRGMRYVAREAKGSDEICVRLRTPGGRWLSHS